MGSAGESDWEPEQGPEGPYGICDRGGVLLYSSDRTRVTRIPDPSGCGGTLICRRLLRPDGASRMRREAEVLGRLSGLAGVPVLLRVLPDGATGLFRDEHASPSAVGLPDGGAPPVWVARMGAELARVLAEVHRMGVVHRDVNPANVLVGTDGRTPFLIDFTLASTFMQDQPDSFRVDQITGTLPYLAPEQTGRTGRAVDHRADLYGLGATLYHLACGHPPFGADERDPLALVYAHLAEPPPPLTSVASGTPPALAAVVAKLLMKEPDQRYQSAEGVAHDLERIASQLEDGATADDISLILGERDFPAQLVAPSRLIGRDEEISVLAEVLEQVRDGDGRGLLVEGPPGVGKTALMDELRPLVAHADGWLLAGKFDQFRQSLDTDAVAQVLRALGRLLLADPRTDPAQYRRRLVDALGPQAGLLAGLSELAGVLGVDPEPLQGDPGKLARRIQQGVVALLREVASPQRPIVMVLEDLQWAGAFPIGVVDELLTADGLAGVLLVATYRGDEVDSAHPLSAMTARWERLGVMPRRLALGNLTPRDFNTFLAEILRLDPSATVYLAQAVEERTWGNPFDTVELLNALRHEGVLRLEESGWTWDTPAIRRFVGARGVSELLMRRLGALPEATRQLLHVLACLGGEVGLPRLALAAGSAEGQVRVDLEPALEDRLLVATGELDDEDTRPFSGVRFRHDQVQQAAYTVLDEGEREVLHLTLARRLDSGTGQEIPAAEQYLHGIDLVRDPQEVRRAIELFLDVADELRVTNAVTADSYLEAAQQALTGISAGDDDPLLVQLRPLRHEVLYGLGRLHEADGFYAEIVRRTANPVRLLDPTCLQISSLTSRRRYADAIALGADLLRRVGLGMPGPEQIGSQIDQGLIALRQWIDAPGPDELDRPEIDDPRLLVAARVINRITTPAIYSGDQVTVAWLVLQAQRFWAEHGPCVELAGPFSLCGSVTISFLGDYQVSYRVMQRVLPFVEARGTDPLASQIRMFFALFSNNWAQPLESTAYMLEQARDGLIRGGDVHLAGYAYVNVASAMIQFAPTLDAVDQGLAKALAFAVRRGHDSAQAHLQPYVRLIRALRGETRSPGSFSDDTFDEEQHLASLSGDLVNKAIFHVYRAVSAALCDDPPALARHAALAVPAIEAVPAAYVSVLARLTQGLSLAHRIRTRPEDEDRDALLAELDGYRAWMTARSGDAPMNYGHMAACLDAERAWAVGDFEAAARAFDRALVQVEYLPRPWNRALIMERAALFSLQYGLERTGRKLLGEALSNYARWGASAKAAQLQHDHPFLPPVVAAETDTGHVWSSAGSTSTTEGMSSQAIDLVAVLRASHALSTETDPELLRERVVDVLVQLTGATHVRLALWNDEESDWYVPVRPRELGSSAGERTSNCPDNEVIGANEAARRGLLPITAFRYVERTGEPLVVDDVAADPRFSADSYLTGVGHCSLLVVPILARGMPRAILMLENHLVTAAFSADRVDAVLVIAGQLASGLDNALGERFRSLVQRSGDLTVVCDPAGDIRYASSASTELLGQDPTAVLGTRLTDLAHLADVDAVRDWLADGGTQPDVIRFRLAADPIRDQALADGPDGRKPPVRWLEATCTDLSHDPAVGGLMVRLRDVTERYRLETELRHTQKLESVGQLAAGIAHEINTPIQYIRDNLTFLRGAFVELSGALGAFGGPLAEGAPKEVQELLDEVPQALADTLDGATRVATIVRAMKTFGHPGGEGMTPTDLNDLVRNTVAVARGEIRVVAEVELFLDSDLTPVMCDSGDINQVLLNLVINAAQAMDETYRADGRRGTLTIRTRGDADFAVIEVQDTGPGIPPEIAERMFDQFFTTKPVGLGTGLGLSLAHTLVHDRHHGSLTFETALGVGTTFIVRLPRQPTGAPGLSGGEPPA